MLSWAISSWTTLFLFLTAKSHTTQFTHLKCIVHWRGRSLTGNCAILTELFSLMIIVLPWRRQWHPTPVLLPGKFHGRRRLEGCSPWGRWGSDTTEWLHFTFHFHALEKEMATHSSVLAWRIPGTGEPGRLKSTGLPRVGHDWGDLAARS